MLSRQQIRQFIAGHRLPAAFVRLIDEHYLPLAGWLARQGDGSHTLIVGINGAQGTGKSTLADFLQIALESALESTARRVAVLSIDDFYLTRAERRRLGNDVHPLLQTRGVPGTHDTGLLANSLDRLAALGDGEQIRLPAFDKSTDDRAPAERWPVVTGPVDFVLFEGWCVGTLPQTSEALREPVNELERELDADGHWRGFVNAQLTGPYARMFAKLERLIFLQSPGFDAIRRWRAGQEHKLAASAGPDAPGIMTATELERFIQHYERLTRANLAALPDAADVVLCLDERHGCQESRYNVAG